MPFESIIMWYWKELKILMRLKNHIYEITDSNICYMLFP